MRTVVLRLLTLICVAFFASHALADDWNVVRSRGLVLQLVDGEWRPLVKGAIVPDTRVVRTQGTGRVTLVRGEETIELGPNTQIQIYDQGGRKPFTTVLQHFGVVSIEAEVRNVQHFAVKNAYLAAVVKGTRFTVTAGRRGGSVEVTRGQVAVENTAHTQGTLILAGQKAVVAKGNPIVVSGKPIAALKRVTDTNAATAAELALEAIAALEAARASGDADAIKAAEKAAKEAIEDAKKAAKEAEKASEKAAKAADKAVEKAGEDADKAAEDAAKAAQKAAEEAAKAAEEARKAAEKAAKDLLKLK